MDFTGVINKFIALKSKNKDNIVDCKIYYYISYICTYL